MSIWVLNKNKDKYEIFPQKARKSIEKSYNIDLIKYYVFFAFFSLTAGLATPTERFLNVITQTLSGNVAFIFVIIIIFSIIASLLIGIIFDYFGRIGALSYIILALAFATYIHSFHYENIDLPLVVIYTVYLAVIMCVPLLIGDSTTRDKYGKTISFSYIIIGMGILIGLYLRISIPFIILNVFLAENVISGTILMSCIVCFIFLINMRESLPKIEQEWSNYLIHMYIIHDSGILLYEHSFITEQENISADLKAGGIIGVKNILKEIIRGEKEVRTIDHGDRKLILKFNDSGRVIFTLVVKQELIVLRKKLDLLIEDFDKNYGQFTDDISLTGIDMRIFKPIKYLARKYFGR
jgi:type IV secretory pathway VirB2 component (pilin)